MDVELRDAREEDWPAAWALQREAFEDLVTRTYGGWTDEQVQKCREAWAPGSTRMIVASGVVVGWVRVERHADHDWLDLVVVGGAARGRGLGTRVMTRVIAEAEDRGVPLWLSVYRTNRARALYRRLGFGERERDEIRVLMHHPATLSAPPPR
ncbi:MAG: GNAT family N-acetyltransferase [Alphaproteobacteria bacterium]|nr:GNAT family N-acetyltransferase [Alphaproteobacteria bacterium]